MAGGVTTMTTTTTTTTRSIENTPTWAIAAVCFCSISISIVLEYSIHYLSSWLKRRGKNALNEALEKLKSELMLLGFISLLLAATQRPISKICINSKVADTMLPCHKISKISEVGKSGNLSWSRTISDRLLFSPYDGDAWRSERVLLGNNDTTTAVYDDHCSSKGMVSLISEKGLGQLHIFIFVLAVMHVVYSALTMALGRAKMRRWKAWERETQTIDYQVSNDPNRFRYTRDTTFARRHMDAWTKTSIHLWIKCFFRQFFSSVAKVDYLTLRHGFISTHLSVGSTFNFQKYIERSLEDDFKVVVGISPPLWLIVVIFLLFNVHAGVHIYLWISVLPLIILLALGTKLEVIVARMAMKLVESQNSVVIRGTPLVKPNDELFWFGHPRFLLHFLHLTLFVNAYELAFFIWITYEFGLNSCYHDKIEILILRIVLAVIVQVLCSYITLPLYALVTQMGSQYKSVVLEEQTARLLKEWHAGVRKKQRQKHKKQEEDLNSPKTSNAYGFYKGPQSSETSQAQVTTNPHDLPIRSSNHTFDDEIVEEARDEKLEDVIRRV
ncbi:Mlo-related protein [Macleaya cordata]|uniref:MLO-like protein n=1 Tax=Macleaya cordata TaxID=56857 RepID=A0A200R5V1_MACCD|nr:Mlo-related protein [Macleaya cordata]